MKAPKFATFRYIAPGLLQSSRPHFRQIYSLKKKHNVSIIYDVRHRTCDDLIHKFLEIVLCKLLGIKYHRIPFTFKNGKFPTLEDFEKISKEIEVNHQKGKNTLVHCRSGLHRSIQVVAFHEITQGQKLEEVYHQKDFFLRAYEIIEKYFNVNNRNYWKRDYKSEVVNSSAELRKNIDNNIRLDAINIATENFLNIIYRIIQ